MRSVSSRIPLNELRSVFGERLQENVSMASYTTAKVGGLADALLPVHSSAELEQAVEKMWELKVPFTILGSGANVLVSDAGFRGVVIHNRAHLVKIETHGEQPTVWAESGANFSSVSRQAALRGFSGLEWACAIPGTVGGAVYGNAGAFGSNTQACLVLAEILHPQSGHTEWTVDQMQYTYRSSWLKQNPGQVVILAARLKLTPGTPQEVQARMAEINAQRRKSQPPGASMGSMFKNPGGDFAGRLIESAGLKGTSIGGVEVSPIHANFFINRGDATANDYYSLIQLVKGTVKEKFDVDLQLEVELLGEWPHKPSSHIHSKETRVSHD